MGFGVFIYLYCAFCVSLLRWIMSDEEDGNLIKLLGAGLAWPVLAIAGVCKGIIWISRRLIRDARALLPARSKTRRKVRKRVAAESPVAQATIKYEPGSWR